MDWRSRVPKDSVAGLSSKELAERYHVSRVWVDALKQRQRETRSIAPRKQTKFHRRVLEGREERLAALVAAALGRGDVGVLDKPRCTQAAGGPCGHHTRPRASELPAALQSGFQSDRTRVREIGSVLRAIRPRSFDHVTELVAVALALFT